MLQGLDIPPGVVRQGTTQGTRNRWWDTNLIRWRQGVMRPVGGWRRLPSCSLPERAYAMLSWRDNGGVKRLALGGLTSLGMYDGTLADITPAGFVPLRRPGLADGFGVGPFGVAAFGTPRAVNPSGLDRTDPGTWWDLDNFGEDLLALSTGDGVLRRWSPGDTVAVAVPGAPIGARAVSVTPERHVVLCGAGSDPRTVAWSDGENPDVWASTLTNLAGDLQLQTASLPVAAVRVREGTLILTETDAHLLRWVGAPYAYGLERIGGGCGPAGPKAVAGDLGFAAWMGGTGFWTFDGGLRPLPCPVQDAVYADINRRALPAAFAVSFEQQGELWWFYPSSTSVECDRYVSWCWAEQTWAVGRLERTAGVAGGAWGSPLLADPALLVQEHEQGWLADGASRVGTVYAETGDLQAGDGDRFLSCHGIMHDLTDHPERVSYRFYLRNAPHRPPLVRGPYAPLPGYGRRPLKLTARALRLRVEASADGGWGLGRPRLELGPGSRR